MAVKIMSAAFVGIEGRLITVEVEITRGLPSFNVVGLADISVKESKERVRAAIINSGFEFPISRITVNLAPADTKKEGSLFDLPIAIGILIATRQISPINPNNILLFGELSLSGDIKKVRGALPITIIASQNKFNKVVIPYGNAKECSVVEDIKIYPFFNLRAVTSFLSGKKVSNYKLQENDSETIKASEDFSDVYGQESTKRAMEIAAAGFHNIILYGPPGSGKTMLAKRLPSILPKLTYREALEVTKIYSVSGNLDENKGLIFTSPFRNPHHTCSKISLVGGGSKLMPGEVSLAHNGVLFLDEIGEFNKASLEVLRQPLEDRTVKINRAMGSVTYPANLMLVAALNPCPCGYFGTDKMCKCNTFERNKYLKKISGPLIDRIDLMVSVRTVPYNEIIGRPSGETSTCIKRRVEIARERQKERFMKHNINYNSQIDASLLNRYCILSDPANKLMEKIYSKFSLSTRAYSRILKVSRTIADLANRDLIEEEDLIEAINYRRFIDEKIV